MEKIKTGKRCMVTYAGEMERTRDIITGKYDPPDKYSKKFSIAAGTEDDHERAVIHARVVDIIGAYGGIPDLEEQEEIIGNLKESSELCYRLFNTEDMDGQSANYLKNGFNDICEPYIFIDEAEWESDSEDVLLETIAKLPAVAMDLFGVSATLVFYHFKDSFGKGIPEELTKYSKITAWDFYRFRYPSYAQESWLSWASTTPEDILFGEEG